MLVDVSTRLEQGAVYRLGTPPVDLRMQRCFHEDEGGYYEAVMLSMPLHTATHIDVVNIENRIELDRSIGPGKMIEVSGIIDRKITLDDCEGQVSVEKGDFVFFRTGWDSYAATERYFNHPELSEEVLDWLVGMKVNMVGIDALGLGRGRRHGIYDRHLTSCGIYVIENLANLSAVTSPSFKVYCFPLKIENTDALPARVVVDL